MKTRPSPLLVDLPSAWKRRFGSELPPLVEKPLERMLGIRRLNRSYAANRTKFPASDRGSAFWSEMLAGWDLDYSLTEKELEGIPARGPVIITANHPFGFVDGLVLCGLLSKRRTDLKVLANQELGRLAEFSGIILPVNNYGGAEACRENMASLREAIRHLRAGGAVVTFPAGEVSTRHGKAGICDAPWHPNTARLIRMTGASVVPVFFKGANSPLFHAAGAISPALRTALLPREFLRRCGRVVEVRVGKALPPARIIGGNDQASSDLLRAATYALSARPTDDGPVVGRSGSRPGKHGVFRPEGLAKPRELAALAAAQDRRLMAEELESLPTGATLLTQGGLRVFLANSWRIPLVLKEIGRERERTFRLVGEGTGEPLDLDRHDRNYLHLILWDAENRCLAGAYRLGRSDVLIRRLGLSGLYTHSLFRYDQEFFERTGPVLELGRSFVVPEYQRKPQPLHLLWRGIGEYVSRNPRYRRFIGPVSMSADYHPAARAVVVSALSTRWAEPALTGLVSPRRPADVRLLPRGLSGVLGDCLRDESDLSTLVSIIQPNHAGLPVLLKHYLRLNARAVACNVDPAFGDCLDALIVVDTLAADPKVMARYVGEEGLAKVREYANKRAVPEVVPV